MALFSYGTGCTPKHTAGNKHIPSPLTQPCLVNSGCGLANSTRANSTLSNTIYKVTPTMDDDKLIPNNTLSPRPSSPPLHSPADLANSPAKATNNSGSGDPCDTLYGTLRKEAPTLKAVPPPTIPPSSITPTQTPMLSMRPKKTVTICDSVDKGRAVSPVSPERI